VNWNQYGYVVRVSENALLQLVQAGLEAYSIHHLRGEQRPLRALETYGLVWGHESVMTGGRTLYAVEMALVDTSALRTPSKVQPVPDALELKWRIMAAYWPHLELLGDFHTHPWATVEMALQKRRDGTKRYWFSKQDIRDLETRPEFLRRHRFRVALALTIAQMQKRSTRAHRMVEHGAVEFTLGTYRLWLKAYVVMQNGANGGGPEVEVSAHTDRHVALDCPSLVGLGEYEPFRA
jgi:hypothetical protein